MLGAKAQSQRHWRGNGQDKGEDVGAESPQTQELVLLVKMTVRHEQELMRLRPDVGLIGFGDTTEMGCVPMLRTVALEWSEMYATGKVKTALKTIMALSMMKDLKQRAERNLARDRLQRCLNVGWIIPSENSLNPASPMKHSEAMKHIDTLIQNLPKEGVPTRFASAKQQHLQGSPPKWS